MSTVHICLNDIFGVAVAGCEVIFYPGDTPFINGSALAVSGARSIRLDAEGNGSVTLLAGRYAVRFSGITGNSDTLLIQVPSDAESYLLPALICGGNWVLPMRDFLQKSKNLSDVADPAAAFGNIKQAATADATGVVQLASQQEVTTGTDAAKAVTPATLAGRLAGISGTSIKLVTVANATARLALTAADVNRFDEVEQTDTRAVYQALDTTLLAQEAGWLPIGTRPATSGGGGSSLLLTGLAGYWKLDETSGVRADATANGNDLSDSNGVGSIAGKIGNAASFDGTTYLSTSASFDITQDFTFAAWVKRATSDETGVIPLYIGGNGYYYQLYFNSDAANPGGPVLNPSDYGDFLSIAGFTDPDATPHLIAFSYNATTGTITLRVDGQKFTRAAVTPAALAGPLVIGQGFSGWVDEAGFWTRELSDSDYATLYNAGNGKTYPFIA